MSKRLHFTLIIPADTKDDWNRVAAGLGFDRGPPETWNTFCIPLSADGQEPITHYAARFASSSLLKAVLLGAKQGIYPELTGVVVTEARMAELIDALEDDIYPPTAEEIAAGKTLHPDEETNFYAVVASHGLQIWQAPAL